LRNWSPDRIGVISTAGRNPQRHKPFRCCHTDHREVSPKAQASLPGGCLVAALPCLPSLREEIRPADIDMTAKPVFAREVRPWQSHYFDHKQIASCHFARFCCITLCVGIRNDAGETGCTIHPTSLYNFFNSFLLLFLIPAEAFSC